MPKGGTVELRIYCICGQKMKVSESMYGRPGKCIACRQKIRIPRVDEIPEDTSELYLKDHPELLRKVERPAPAPVAPVSTDSTFPEDAEEIDLEEESPAASGAIPAIDILEPLRDLCSLEYSVARKLAALSEYESETSGTQLRDELKGYQRRIETARADLDEQMRQRLMEVAIELANTHEKIASSGLAARVGEIGFRAFREKVEKLRRRREALEKLQQDLRGWLTCRDPHVAGGFVELPFDQIPQESVRLNLTGDLEGKSGLIDRHIEGIRRALFARERAERKLSETERLQSGSTPIPGLAELRADGKAEKRRADAAIRFYRARLEQLKKDYDSDMLAVASQLDLARGRLQVGELSRPQFDELEAELERAKMDMAKATELLGRGMNANTVRDVPQLRGTFLARLSRPLGQEGIESDSWIAWGAALALIASILLPAAGGRSALGAFNDWHANYPWTHWFLTVPVLGAVFVSLAGLVPKAALRGVLVLGLGALICIAGALGLHEAAYSATDVGRVLRESGLVRPGTVMFFLAAAAVMLSSCIALSNVKAGWAAVVPAVLGTGIVLFAIVTDAWGYFLPAPEVSVTAVDGAGGVQVTLTNAGHRAMHVVSDTGETGANVRTWNRPFQYYYSIERQIGQGSWRPQRVQDLRGQTSSSGPLAGGRSVEHQYTLTPGVYRVTLTASSPERNLASSPITVDAPAAPQTPGASEPAPAAPPSASASAQNPPSASTGSTTPAAAPGTGASPVYVGMSMELRGLVRAPEREPQFAIVIHLPDGSTRERRVSTGGNVYEKWIVREFNPQESTVTVTNGQSVYILRRGERVDIPADK
ncbi:MAG: hypothetical protein HZB26_23860 [Candidatus Hydrogenedentes bacterium]|nr:hypothetical protein [Candidatus Hydrogenedentota bacterium]